MGSGPELNCSNEILSIIAMLSGINTYWTCLSFQMCSPDVMMLADLVLFICLE
ncbi:hypothetical protein [Serratia marcescens]|uniref:hypothetical protein n=1 Tax=Serratia marcescens TaxID=615 RepID=UPI0013DAB726|nr:hypothetical protein [Serratia marcescens]